MTGADLYDLECGTNGVDLEAGGPSMWGGGREGPGLLCLLVLLTEAVLTLRC